MSCRSLCYAIIITREMYYHSTYSVVANQWHSTDNQRPPAAQNSVTKYCRIYLRRCVVKRQCWCSSFRSKLDRVRRRKWKITLRKLNAKTGSTDDDNMPHSTRLNLLSRGCHEMQNVHRAPSTKVPASGEFNWTTTTNYWIYYALLAQIKRPQ